ncbi:MAG: acetyl-CoA carboxylase biotin carboxylase subunit [Deltaproteobacteria bacterium]|nr:acetyl-CoA carboxylase biotin carboxylase subunit [Deltaproteobacteria bacterium]
MFNKILIANRGEIALRVIRTCQEMGISCVAVHSEIDADSLHVRAADSAVALGDDQPAESYLNIKKIIKAAKESGAQAIHPGYGFLSENADFAAACEEAGLVFIGPPSHVLKKVADKVEARKLAEQVAVEITPGTDQPSEDIEKLSQAAKQLGFPVMVKAAAGGGGKGMRRVDRAQDIKQALELAASEARTAFSNGKLFLEKCIEKPRHIEVQILADQHDNVVHLFERECSIQRRHQKIIEEAPSPAVDQEMRARLGAAAIKVIRAAGYQGAGTVEFLFDAGKFYFMEVNARLQVEHPVTEFISGLDLVEQQIRIAAGEPLDFDQASLRLQGHAIECRIYAEDPQAGFLPSPGAIAGLHIPSGPGIRFDCGIEVGSQVPVHYDPILAKLISWGSNRNKAIARMIRALKETSILGVKTPVELLLQIMESEPFRQAQTTTDFIEKHFSDFKPAEDKLQIALIGWLVNTLEGSGSQTTSRPAASGLGVGHQGDPWQRLGHWRLGE